jgi:hypothetical protein
LTPKVQVQCPQGYNDRMTQAAEELLQQMLQLPEEDRELIADSLWRSAHGASVEAIAKEWKIKIDRPVAENGEKVQGGTSGGNRPLNL